MKQAIWRGICWAVTSVIPVVAILAVTTGLPIPFRGWAGGVDVALQLPFWMVFFGVMLGGFIPLGVIGAVGGGIYHRRTKSGHSPSDGPRQTILDTVTILAAIVTAAIAVGSTWNFFREQEEDEWNNELRGLGLAITWACTLLLAYRATTGDWLPVRWRDAEGTEAPSPSRKAYILAAACLAIIAAFAVYQVLHQNDNEPPPVQLSLSPIMVITGDEGQRLNYWAVSSDGRTLAFVNDATGNIRLWDVEAVKELPPLKRTEGRRFLFVPGQPALARLSKWEDTTVEILPIGPGKAKRVMQLPEGNAGSLAISPNGKVLATGHPKAVHLFSLETGMPLKSLDFQRYTEPVQSLAFSPDSRTLATGARVLDLPEGVLNPVRFWDVETGKELGSLPRGPYPDERANGLAISPRGDLVAYRTGMQFVIARKADRTEILRDWSPTTDLSFSDDGRWLAWGDIDMMNDLGRRIQADVDETGRKQKKLPPAEPKVWTDTVRLFLYDTASNTTRIIFRDQYPRMWHVAFCGNGKLATAHEDNGVRIWDLTGLMK